MIRFYSCSAIRSGIIFCISCSAILLNADQARKGPKTVIHPHKDGGFVKEWLVLGPFEMVLEGDAVRSDTSAEKVEKNLGIEHDFLRAMGGEKKAIIKNYSAIRVKSGDGKRKFIRAKKVVADSNGIVTIDSLFTDNRDETMYAFCMVEAFIPCSVRCYWGVDGDAKIWINGISEKNVWDCCDSCLPVSKYVDATFEQGYNSVLLKLTDGKQRQRFTFEVWDLRDSLIPFQERIRSLHCETDTFEASTADDSITTIIRFNIPVPQHFFTGDVTMYKESMRAGGRQKVMSYPVPVNKPFAISIPDTLQNVIAITARVKPDKERSLHTIKYVWKGNFNKARDSLHAHYKKIKPDINGNIQTNSFIRMMVGGIYNWATDWFTMYDSLSIDERVRQLGYIQTNAEIIHTLLAGKKVIGEMAYPLYLPEISRLAVGDSVEYEASQWLNYKYPEQFDLPRNVKGASEYRFWLHLPKRVSNKRKKMPLLLALTDADLRGYDINAIKKFGPGGFAEAASGFPFAVVTPLCRYNTLWEPRVLKRLLDTLIATGRFNRRKIFITGTGMGAFTAWHLACSFPEYFAGILPINGGGMEEKACSLKSVSVWAFHGGKNKVVPLEITQEMVNSVKECGGNKIDFSIYPEDDHTMYPKVFNDPRIYQWLKKQ